MQQDTCDRHAPTHDVTPTDHSLLNAADHNVKGGDHQEYVTSCATASNSWSSVSSERHQMLNAEPMHTHVLLLSGRNASSSAFTHVHTRCSSQLSPPMGMSGHNCVGPPVGAECGLLRCTKVNTSPGLTRIGGMLHPFFGHCCKLDTSKPMPVSNQHLWSRDFTKAGAAYSVTATMLSLQ